MTLVIAGEPTTTADPCEGAFDDPSFRHDHEAVLVAAAHDLQFPHARAGANERLYHGDEADPRPKNVCQFMRDNWLSKWNKLIERPWTIMSIGPRRLGQWVQISGSWYQIAQ